MGNINMHERVATGRALGILVNLDHFRHSFILLFQSVIKKRLKQKNNPPVYPQYISFSDVSPEAADGDQPSILCATRLWGTSARKYSSPSVGELTTQKPLR